mmetsp:Transcript_9291/g.20546  ORF Transcript_9291/g.20546 Transcript_9291/m.20546 type:complete len:86 (+) Transcript_9291:173-430(+)
MLLPKRFMLAAAVHLLTLASAISRASVANGQKFVTSYQGCAPGQSGNNCAKMWHVTGEILYFWIHNTLWRSQKYSLLFVLCRQTS